MERYRIHADAHLYYCTFTVVEWLPVFISESACQLVAGSLAHCQQHKCLGIDAYVIMPTHLHLITYDRDWDSERLVQTLTDLRKFTGRQLAEFAGQNLPPCFAQCLRAAAGPDRHHRFWQPTRHPEFIETERFHNQKRDYLHDNPRRKGLVLYPMDWRWSSARWYEQGLNAQKPSSPNDGAGGWETGALVDGL